MKDDEFEGDEQTQKAMKEMLPPLLGGMSSRQKITLEIGRWGTGAGDTFLRKLIGR